MSPPRPSPITSEQPPTYSRTDHSLPKPVPIPIITPSIIRSVENRNPPRGGNGNACSTLSISYPTTSPREPLRPRENSSDHHQRSATLPCQCHTATGNAVKRRRRTQTQTQTSTAATVSSPLSITATEGHATVRTPVLLPTDTVTNTAQGTTPTEDYLASPYATPVPRCRKRARHHASTSGSAASGGSSSTQPPPTTGRKGRWEWIEEDPEDYTSDSDGEESYADDEDEDEYEDEDANHNAAEPVSTPTDGTVHLAASPRTTPTPGRKGRYRKQLASGKTRSGSSETRKRKRARQGARPHSAKRINEAVDDDKTIQFQSPTKEIHSPSVWPYTSTPSGWKPLDGPVISNVTPTVPRPSQSPPIRPTLQYSSTARMVNVVSESEITRGTELLATEPAYAVLNTCLLKTHCSGCLISVRAKADVLGMSIRVARQSFETCPTCKQCIFCDYCFEGRGLKHRMECKILAQPEGELPSTELRLLMKLLMSDQSRLEGLPDYSPPWSPNLTTDERKIVKELARWWPTHNRKAFEAGEYGPIHDHRPSLDVQVKALRRMRTCRFPLFDSDYNLIGYCLYRELSRINHSCDPNAQIVYPFDSMGKRFTRLIATRDIEDGEELTISYCDTGLPIHQREHLLSQYGFFGLKRHQCELCASYEVDPRWAAHHQHCKAEDRGLLAIMNPTPEDGVNAPPCTQCGMKGYYHQSKLPLVLPENNLIWPSYRMETTGHLTGGTTALSAEPSDGNGPDVPVIQDGLVQSADQPELVILFKFLNETKTLFPKTLYPIPLLQRRAARLFAENRVLTLGTTKTIIAHLHEALFAYDTISTSASSPVSCAIYVTVLITRLAQLQAIATSRPLLPRLQQLRDSSSKGSMSSRELRELIWVVKGEAEEADDMLNAVYRQCKGDLWERYQKVKMDLDMLLKIVDPTKR